MSMHATGWRPQLPDHRDYRYTPPTLALPGVLSLRQSPHNGPVLNQGQLGACVPNSNADAYRTVLGIDGLKQFLPSRLYIYAQGRRLEGTPLSEDSGMTVRDALTVIHTGVPPESDEPYSDANPGPFQLPPDAQAIADAPKSHSVIYQTLNPQASGHPLRACIAQGYPFTFGFSVPALLQSDQMASGADVFLPLPNDTNNQLTGDGHGVQCVGYDFTCTRFDAPAFEIKNTWGEAWGDAGYFYMDFRFFDQLATDLWTVRTAT